MRSGDNEGLSISMKGSPAASPRGGQWSRETERWNLSYLILCFISQVHSSFDFAIPFHLFLLKDINALYRRSNRLELRLSLPILECSTIGCAKSFTIQYSFKKVEDYAFTWHSTVNTKCASNSNMSIGSLDLQQYHIILLWG